MFGLFKNKNEILTRREKKRIVNLIQDIESKTSGEVRVYIEGECPFDNTMQRAEEVFNHLGMYQTQLHNAVLLYIATESKKFAILGDTAIYDKTGNDFWQNKASSLTAHFKTGRYAEGIEVCLKEIGASLNAYFPPTGIRKNELPDDIVFGKFN